MTKEDKPKEKSLEDVFDDAEFISVYSDREAVDDGVLFAVAELCKVSPRVPAYEGVFQYMTSNLCLSKGYLTVDHPVIVEHFLDLFVPLAEHMRSTGPNHCYNLNVEFPDGTTGEVYAVRNNSGRYTIMSPEEY